MRCMCLLERVQRNKSHVAARPLRQENARSRPKCLGWGVERLESEFSWCRHMLNASLALGMCFSQTTWALKLVGSAPADGGRGEPKPVGEGGPKQTIQQAFGFCASLKETTHTKSKMGSLQACRGHLGRYHRDECMGSASFECDVCACWRGPRETNHTWRHAL